MSSSLFRERLRTPQSASDALSSDGYSEDSGPDARRIDSMSAVSTS
jgi:hypothetical protein